MDKELDGEYYRALRWIHSTGRFGIKPGLERMSAMLERLGNPHRSLRFLHIGGTNGKGSTAVMAASIFKAAGYSTGLYTSPYLLSFTNRMAVNGQDISPGELVELVDKLRPLVSEISELPALGQPTEFEVVTALAMLFFSRRKPDLVVLEVGLGGRLDATNVVTPLLSVITNVSLEHTSLLGGTLREIAMEKAGIIKTGAPLLTAADSPEVLQVMEERCRRLNCPLYRVAPLKDEAGSGQLVNCESAVFFSRRNISSQGQTMVYQGFRRSMDDLFIPLRGGYQVTNAATALAAAEILEQKGYSLAGGDLRRGLKDVKWPGRLEVLSRTPLLIMDGAHNPAALNRLAETLPEYFNFKRLILVIGIMADKDIKAMLEALVPLASEVVLTRPSLPRAAEPHKLEELLRETRFSGVKTHREENIRGALQKALALASPRDAVLVTGSLYTVSEARAYWIDNCVH